MANFTNSQVKVVLMLVVVQDAFTLTKNYCVRSRRVVIERLRRELQGEQITWGLFGDQGCAKAGFAGRALVGSSCDRSLEEPCCKVTNVSTDIGG
jgi:hypothetical protein